MALRDETSRPTLEIVGSGNVRPSGRFGSRRIGRFEMSWSWEGPRFSGWWAERDGRWLTLHAGRLEIVLSVMPREGTQEWNLLSAVGKTWDEMTPDELAAVIRRNDRAAPVMKAA